ncbi:MAG: ATP-binding cassette domain-containing protein [Myxococcota bacterium]
MGAETVRLDHVTRTFGRHVAVSSLDLRLEAGRIYGLLGANGAGKSTTTKLVMGLLIPDSGTVTLLGAPPDDAGRSRIGYVPEVRALPEDARVFDTLVFFARLRGATRSDAQRSAQHQLDQLDFPEKAKSRIKDLSNGQQQKLQIAIALTGDPALLVLDEPLTALDPTHQERALGLFRNAARAGATVLLATHRLWEAEAFIDHVVLLSQGTKRLDRPLKEALAEAFTNTWRVRATTTGWVRGDDVVDVREDDDGSVLVQLAPGADAGALLRRAASADAGLQSVEAVLPNLQDLFLKLVR